MVEKAVKDGGGDGGVAVEDGGPLFEGFIGGEDDGTAFVAGADDLEEEVGSALVDGQVANFVQDEKSGSGVFAEFGFEGSAKLGGVEGVDDVDGVGKEDVVALQAGGVAEGGGEVGLAQADKAQKQDVGFVGDEAQAESRGQSCFIVIFRIFASAFLQPLSWGKPDRIFRIARQQLVRSPICNSPVIQSNRTVVSRWMSDAITPLRQSLFAASFRSSEPTPKYSKPARNNSRARRSP